MTRTLLLCFIHGFKGDDDTFRNFPADLKRLVSSKLPDNNVESIVYPKYETKGELAQCSEAFLAWLKEQVIRVRKTKSENPWPPHDRDVGVVLVAHSMGGFVASDTLCLVLNERLASGTPDDNPMFPLIQGVLTFDTPFNGLARSMFVYGAFSNYQKVSSVFNVMTALSAAAPSALSRSAVSATSSSSPMAAASSVRRGGGGGSAWKGWQLIAVRTGTVGAIAAGGVTAYMHRRRIAEAARGLRDSLSSRESMREGYQQGVDTLSQGLAYVNRGSVGRSFEYLSDHFTFVGSLMKQQELGRRLERLAGLRGVGVHDFYTSLGENGVWSGGYFVPERTFCAIPAASASAAKGGKGEEEQEEGTAAADPVDTGALFSRQVIRDVDDEIQAHVSMFAPEKNKGYERMADDASDLVVRWFADDTPLFDDPKFAAPVPAEPVPEPVETTPGGDEVPKTASVEDAAAAAAAASREEGAAPKDTAAAGAAAPADTGERGGDVDNSANEYNGQLPDESPMDIAAAASLVPLPDDEATGDGSTTIPPQQQQQQRETYLRYLMGVASQAGTGVSAYVPRSMPEMPSIPSGPSFRSFMPSQMPSIPRPSVNLFGSGGSSAKSKPAEESGDDGGVSADAGQTEEEAGGVKTQQEKPDATVAQTAGSS